MERTQARMLRRNKVLPWIRSNPLFMHLRIRGKGVKCHILVCNLAVITTLAAEGKTFKHHDAGLDGQQQKQQYSKV